MPPVILVSGNDTGVGKTRACAALVRRLAASLPTSYLKPVETGTATPVDAAHVIEEADSANLRAHTLLNFRAPLAPVEAARLEGKTIDFPHLLDQARSLAASANGPLVVEGAGGLATPIDEAGRDWLAFARSLAVDYLVLVAENRLGLLNQVRLLTSHLGAVSFPCGLWLNQARPQDATTLDANARALPREALPVWAKQTLGASEPAFTAFPWETTT